MFTGSLKRYTERKYGEIIKKRSLNDTLLANLFPNSKDYEKKEGRYSWLEFNISFPERSTETNNLIGKIISHGKKLGYQPMLVAHDKAIGIEYQGISFFVPALKDPYLCLVTEKMVLVFPNTLWGDIPEEAAHIAELEKSLLGMGIERQN